MRLDGSGERGWKPKAFRPSEPPQPKDIEELIKALMDNADPEILQVYKALALSTPVQRLDRGARQVIRNMAETVDRTNELAVVLSDKEYEAYVYVAHSDVSMRLKQVAESLLCVADRHIISSFFRRSFVTLRGYSLFKLSLEQTRRSYERGKEAGQGRQALD